LPLNFPRRLWTYSRVIGLRMISLPFSSILMRVPSLIPSRRRI